MSPLFEKLAEALRQGQQELMPGLLRVAESIGKRVESVARQLESDDVDRRLQQLREHYQQRGPDPLGLDLEHGRVPARGVEFLHRFYFRTRVSGLARVPQGRALLISNHSGQLPLDGAIIVASMLFDANPPRLVRSMVDRWVESIPALSALFSKLGQVPGAPANCKQLLERQELVLAFPEGIRGISKPITRRYELERFGHGFMRLAMQTESPIVPIAVIGAEEQYISVGNLDWIAQRLGLPVLPVLPQLLVPGGVLPLPTRYYVEFGAPLYFSGTPENTERVAENVWLVRQTIQKMLTEGLAAREGLFV